MLGDSVCQPECFTQGCEYDRGDCESSLCSPGCYPHQIGDKQCDEVCHVEQCEWDDFDCDCFPGCSRTQRDNDVCDQECNVKECQFDGFRCVRVIQGECAPACFTAMVGDRHCDAPCNNEDCSWDGLDCGCAPGCAFSDLAACKNECLVPDCNYGALAGYPACTDLQVRVAGKYHQVERATLYRYLPEHETYDYAMCAEHTQCTPDIWAESFTDCVPGDNCKSWFCIYNFGRCLTLSNCLAAFKYLEQSYCLQCSPNYFNSAGECGVACAPGLTPHPVATDLCVFEKDSTTEADPQVIYVQPGRPASDADGTWARPYSDLSQALSNTKKHFTTILLLPGTHRFEPSFPSFLLFSASTASPKRSFQDRQLKVTIAAYDCEQGKSTCERATLHANADNMPSLRAPGVASINERCFGLIGTGLLEIRNVDIESLGVFHRSPGSKLIDVGMNSLQLVNVTISNVRGFNALIQFEVGVTLTFSSVSFLNVSATLAILRQQSSGAIVCNGQIVPAWDQPANVTYDHGAVAVVVEKSQTGACYFAKVRKVRNFSVSAVSFTGKSQAQNALTHFYFDVCHLCVFARCAFVGSDLRIGYFLQVFAENWSLSADEELAYQSANLTNYQVVDCVFADNKLSAGVALNFQFPNYLQSVLIANCSFERETELLVSVSSLEYVDKVRIKGPARYVTYGKVGEVRLNFAPTFLKIDNSRFVDCAAVGSAYIRVDKMTYVEVRNFTVSQTSNREELCPTILRIESSYAVTISSFNLSNYYCPPGNFLFSVQNSSGLLTLKEFHIANCLGNGLKGVLVSLQSRDEVSVSQARIEDCKNENGNGILYVYGEHAHVSITNSTFRNNTAVCGGALFATELASLSLLNSTFADNLASHSGGAVAVSLESSMAISIVDCRFVSNEAKNKGGAVYVAHSQVRFPVLISIGKSLFIENRSGGGVVYLTAGLELRSFSQVTESNFEGNSVKFEGVLGLQFSKGTLLVSNSRFESNVGVRDGVVSAAYQTAEEQEAGFAMHFVLFRNNSAVALIRISATVFTGRNLTFVTNAGVCLYSESADVYVSDSSFERNTANIGPAVISKTSQIFIERSNFTNNIARNYGGAMLISDFSIFRCVQSQFTNNSAESDGGALFIEQKSLIDMQSCKFEGNFARGDGSALYLIQTDTNSKSRNCQFAENVAFGDGTIYLFSSSFLMLNCSIESNESTHTTAGIVATMSNFTARDSVFRNQTGLAGVWIYVATLSTACIADCVFERLECRATGSVYVDSSKVTIVDCEFDQLRAASGSVVHAVEGSEVVLSNSTATRQRNDGNGAIACYSSVCILDNFRIWDFHGSAVFSKAATVSIISSIFSGTLHSDGQSNQGAGLYCDHCESLLIVGSEFRGLKADIGAGVYLEDRWKSVTFRVENSLFVDNAANKGGAMSADSVVLEVTRTQFLNNSASDAGGAVILLCRDLTENCSFALSFSDFSLNRAGVNGGAISWKAVKPEVSNNTYEKNWAPYGPDVASFAERLKSVNQSLSDVPSGQVFAGFLEFELIDHYGRSVATDNSTFTEIQPTAGSDTLVSGTMFVRAESGRAVFNHLIIVTKPGSNTTLEVAIVGSAQKLLLNVSMRACNPGESEISNLCLPCEPGTFSLTPEEPCSECPPEAICLGNFTIYPRTGYWRASAFQRKFFRCPNPSACLGQQSFTGACAEGYEGNMCQTCARNFYRSFKTICTPCPARIASVFRLIGFLSVISLIAGLLVKSSLKAAHTVKSLHSIYLKVFLNYLQLVMLMGEFNFNWPDMSQKLLNVQSSVGGFAEQLLSVDCLKKDFSENEEFYKKIVLMAFTPLLFALVSSTIWAVIAISRRSVSTLKNELVASGLALFFLVHPSVCRVMLSAFNCEEVETGEYWVAGLELQCWQGEHWKYAMGVALPSLLVWGFGVPGIVLGVMVVQRHKLMLLDLKIRFGYLRNGYKAEKYYWEFIIIYRKLIVICVAVFLTRIPAVIQGLLALAVLGYAMDLQEAHRPFANETLNVMEQRSLLVSIVTLLSGIYFLDEKMSAGLQGTFFGFILLSNVYFLQFWLRKAGRLWFVFIVQRLRYCRRLFRIVDEMTVVLRRSSELALSSKNLSSDAQLPPRLKEMFLRKLEQQSADLWETKAYSLRK